MNELDLESYLSGGVEAIIKQALRASFSNPKESVFLTRYALASRKASKLRHAAESTDNHIPPFLIASITSRCNLHCAGCYSRATNSCHDDTPVNQLSGETWGKLFREAADLGISFIILAGGEPLIRKDVIQAAKDISEIMFPVFTNGTMLQREYLTLFDRNRNLLPVLSLEGNEIATDRRRGNGVYRALNHTMENLTEKGIFFGASITVTTQNLDEVLSENFVNNLYQKGCKIIFYVEYVPMAAGTDGLAPTDRERETIQECIASFRNTYDDMLFLAFPGDETKLSGCLAAGRGFFHINSHGGAEPCPFSPYSDVNVADLGIAGALQSKLFQTLRESGIQSQMHHGGCVLFEKEEQVRSLVSE